MMRVPQGTRVLCTIAADPTIINIFAVLEIETFLRYFLVFKVSINTSFQSGYLRKTPEKTPYLEVGIFDDSSRQI